MPSELSKDLPKILPFFIFMRANIPDINIYNLSDDTAISYDIIPFIQPGELETNNYKNSHELHEKIDFERKANTFAN
ncbi:3-deoxy-D-manno-oct-2-ulosonate III transferase WaaZ [Kosakonia cowanii]